MVGQYNAESVNETGVLEARLTKQWQAANRLDDRRFVDGGVKRLGVGKAEAGRRRA